MFKSHRLKYHGKVSAKALTPMQVARAYNFPAIPAAEVSKRTVAILELGGFFNLRDVYKWCAAHGVPAPRLGSILVGNAVQASSDADSEVSLDICVVAGAAPGCHIVVVFAENTNEGFIQGLQACLDVNPDAISVSWGMPLKDWDADAVRQVDAILLAAAEKGIPTFCAAGDNGSSDGARGKNVDYPAASRYAISVGGTRLVVNHDGSRREETAWSSTLFKTDSTGGGIDHTVPTPDWQHGALPERVAGRRSPDLAANADPESGYSVEVNGSIQTIGGTSGAAPLMAALHVLLNAKFGQHIGNLHTKFYSFPECFFDVTEGTNGAYRAASGYDCVTGLGVLDAARFMAVLATLD